MLKVLSFRTFGAFALSLSLLLGALLTTPVPSTFAKVVTTTKPVGTSTLIGRFGLDNDGDELNETDEPAMVIYSQAYNRRIDGQWTFKNGRG